MFLKEFMYAANLTDVQYKIRRTKQMTEIYLCDNELIWLEQMEQAISDFIISSDWALAIACRASAPQELLNQLMQHRTSGGIYFLDINLRSEMNGITLGAEFVSWILKPYWSSSPLMTNW